MSLCSRACTFACIISACTVEQGATSTARWIRSQTKTPFHHNPLVGARLGPTASGTETPRTTAQLCNGAFEGKNEQRVRSMPTHQTHKAKTPHRRRTAPKPPTSDPPPTRHELLEEEEVSAASSSRSPGRRRRGREAEMRRPLGACASRSSPAAAFFLVAAAICAQFATGACSLRPRSICSNPSGSARGIGDLAEGRRLGLANRSPVRRLGDSGFHYYRQVQKLLSFASLFN